jgi:ribonuclease D
MPGGSAPVAEAVEPREGVPPVIDDLRTLQAYARSVAAGTGPMAVDAERASGYRYSQRAYLIQVRREGAGTALIDPTMVPDLQPLQEASWGVEWVLHAATQDLPCLAEVGLRPAHLFDTELAGRLLGRERVSLAALVESELGHHLVKGHGAADWSARPLKDELLQYATLDVEWLVELRDALHGHLEDAGKLALAQEEFSALLGFTPRERREEPWRRTSGVHRIRKPRSLAVVRSLWQARDSLAQRLDIAPGRVLPDEAIVAAAEAMPDSSDVLGSLKQFAGRGQQRRLGLWWSAIGKAMALSDEELPATASPATGPPPPRAWADRDPQAWARLQIARDALSGESERMGIPIENLISPELVRQVCWDPPLDESAEHLGLLLRSAGARPWQVALAVPILAAAIREADLPPQ